MRRITSRFLVPSLLLPSLTGCVVVNLHSTRPVSVRVTYKETNTPASYNPTKTPASDVLVEVDYSYTGYGIFYILNLPTPVSARTDRDGLATVRMISDANHMSFKVNGNPFWVTETLIRYGGYPDCVATYHPPQLDVELTPVK